MKNFYFTVTFALVLMGCKESDSIDTLFPDTVEKLTVEVYKTRVDEAETDKPYKQWTDLLDEDFKKDISILYISQRGQNVTPSFGKNAGSENLYAYVYNGNKATWDEGTNFNVIKNGQPFSWKNVKQIGPVGNSYDFFAMYFPHTNTVPEVMNDFSVMTDQSSKENLNKSNILGAYHVTSSLYSQLKFRLFHLTCFLNVTVYIPVFENENNSGFYPQTTPYASVIGAYPNFLIDWAAVRSSDTMGPLVTAKESETSDIKMFLHPINEAEPETAEIDISDFYPFGDPGVTKDQVYVYRFSVMFPPQPVSFSRSNFLRFTFNTVSGASKNYYFNGSTQQIGGGLDMSQGNLQELNLYIPRNGDGVILVKANVNPWTQADIIMNVTKKEKS